MHEKARQKIIYLILKFIIEIFSVIIKIKIKNI